MFPVVQNSLLFFVWVLFFVKKRFDLIQQKANIENINIVDNKVKVDGKIFVKASNK